MKKIKYIGYYDTIFQRRIMSPAAVDKMNYISEKLSELGYIVEIISCGMIADKGYKGTKEKIGYNIYVKYFRTLKKSKLKIINKVFRAYELLVLFMYFLICVKKEEKILVYHSLMNMKAIFWAKKIKKFKIILEIEEIYADVLENQKLKKKEINYLEKADYYLFSTTFLNKEINKYSKPYVIIHGVYKVEKIMTHKFNDNKIHLIYAGTFDLHKGGVKIAIQTAQYLPSNYVIHILGFGTSQQVEHVKDVIREINNKSCKSTVVYEGLKVGQEYTRFIQKCHIGLSTQVPEGNYNNSSFPSKILSYLRNGLDVISIKIPVVENSDINSIIYYYNDSKPEAIANMIKNIKLKNNYIGMDFLITLDQKFKLQLDKLLKK